MRHKSSYNVFVCYSIRAKHVIDIDPNVFGFTVMRVLTYVACNNRNIDSIEVIKTYHVENGVNHEVDRHRGGVAPVLHGSNPFLVPSAQELGQTHQGGIGKSSHAVANLFNYWKVVEGMYLACMKV